jgi:hypothetical protein
VACGNGVEPNAAMLTQASTFNKDLIYYRQIADNIISYTPSENILVRNQRISAAYARLFTINPRQYSWFGAAMHASWSVGFAMSLMQCWLDGNCPAQVSGSPGDLIIQALQALSRSQVEHMQAQLALGNINVFHSVYPPFLAFQDGGIDEMNYLQQSGQLSYDPEANIINAVDEVYYNNNPLGEVQNLLNLEQQHVLVPAFTPDLAPLSPVTFLFYSDDLSDNEWFWAQKYNGHVGNITNTDDRWLWVVDKVIPHYMNEFNNNMSGLLGWASEHGAVIGGIVCGCWSGNGAYCGADTVDFNNHAHPMNCVMPFYITLTDLYQCNNNSWGFSQHCGANGCYFNPQGPDGCNSGPCPCYSGNGLYCGGEVIGYQNQHHCTLPFTFSSGDLYSCSNGAWSLSQRCSQGQCVFNPNGPDHCAQSCAGPVCGGNNQCCAAGDWCGAQGQCCSGCSSGCFC